MADQLTLRLFQNYPLTSRVCQHYGTLFFHYLLLQGVLAEFALATNFELSSDYAESVPSKIARVTGKLNQHINQKLNDALFALGWAINVPSESTMAMAKEIMSPIEFKRKSTRTTRTHPPVLQDFGAVIESADLLCEFRGTANYNASLYEVGTQVRFEINGSLKVDARRISRYRVHLTELLISRRGFDDFCLKVEARLMETSQSEIIRQLQSLSTPEQVVNVLQLEN